MTLVRRDHDPSEGLAALVAILFDNLLMSLTANWSSQNDVVYPNYTLIDYSEQNHYISKSEYPKFPANPNNLMQCCLECDKKKSSMWKEGEQIAFLRSNIYLLEWVCIEDLIIWVLSSQPRWEKRSTPFNTIKYHYERLELCKWCMKKGNHIY